MNTNSLINRYAPNFLIATSTDDYNGNEIVISLVKKNNKLYFQVKHFNGAIEEFEYKGSTSVAIKSLENDRNVDISVLNSTISMEGAISFMEENETNIVDHIYYDPETRGIKVYRKNIFDANYATHYYPYTLRTINGHCEYVNVDPIVTVHDSSLRNGIENLKAYKESIKRCKFSEVAIKLYDKNSSIVISELMPEELLCNIENHLWTKTAKESNNGDFFITYANSNPVTRINWCDKMLDYDFDTVENVGEPLLLKGYYFDNAPYRYVFFNYLNILSPDYRKFCSAFANKQWDTVQQLLNASDEAIERFKNNNLTFDKVETVIGLLGKEFSN